MFDTSHKTKIKLFLAPIYFKSNKRPFCFSLASILLFEFCMREDVIKIKVRELLRKLSINMYR